MKEVSSNLNPEEICPSLCSVSIFLFCSLMKLARAWVSYEEGKKERKEERKEERKKERKKEKKKKRRRKIKYVVLFFVCLLFFFVILFYFFFNFYVKKPQQLFLNRHNHSGQVWYVDINL